MIYNQCLTFKFEPLEHNLHVLCPLFALNEPALHGIHLFDPLIEYVPGIHDVHTVAPELLL